MSERVSHPRTSPLDALILDILHTVPLKYLYSELTAITSDPDLPYVNGFFHFFKSSPVLSNQLLFSLSESTGGQTFTHCPDFPYKKPLTQKHMTGIPGLFLLINSTPRHSLQHRHLQTKPRGRLYRLVFIVPSV